MSVDKKTALQFQTKLRTGITNRTRRYDTGYGPVPDLVLTPLAGVLEDQNNSQLRPVSLRLSLSNPDEFSEEDLDEQAFNEGLIRPAGSQATATLTFSRATPFGAGESGIVQRGFPVGTSADEATGQGVTFITTEAKDKTSAVAVLDPDTNQTVYQLRVAAIALINGDTGKVGPDRVNRPLRPLVGYDSVTNEAAAQEGRNRYSNADLIELMLLAVSSRQLAVAGGSEFHIRDNFDSVEDVLEVYGSNPLLTRAATDAGAVDAFVLGENLVSVTETVTFLGLGQKLALSTPPVVRVDSVTRVSDSEVFEEDSDYALSLDTSGVSGSTRAVDGIKFLATAAATPSLAAGDQIEITYVYNQLIRDLQADETDPEVKVQGRDLLYRMGETVEIFLSATLTAKSGFVFSTIQTLVQTVVIDYINALGLGAKIEASDIQGQVRLLSGVDNFVITKMVREATDTGTTDFTLDGNEAPELLTTNLVISNGGS